jgi:hypothetical protein
MVIMTEVSAQVLVLALGGALAQTLAKCERGLRGVLGRW